MSLLLLRARSAIVGAARSLTPCSLLLGAATHHHPPAPPLAAALRLLPGAIAEIVRVDGRSLDEVTMPRLVFVPAETGRRGPPIRVR